jgi:hypothetical protein
VDCFSVKVVWVIACVRQIGIQFGMPFSDCFLILRYNICQVSWSVTCYVRSPANSLGLHVQSLSSDFRHSEVSVVMAWELWWLPLVMPFSRLFSKFGGPIQSHSEQIR